MSAIIGNMDRRGKPDRTCIQCGEMYHALLPREKYCTPECFKAWYIARNPDWKPMAKLSRTTKPVNGVYENA